MCGIFGVAAGMEPGGQLTGKRLARIMGDLFRLSGSRGKDASGAALLTNRRITVVKRNVAVEKLMRTTGYRSLRIEMESAFSSTGPLAVIGHARMVTDGGDDVHGNNQPLIKNGMVVIHNGIIVNHKAIWREYPEFNRETGSDTEIIPTLLAYYLERSGSLTEAVHQFYKTIEGVATIAVLFEDGGHLLIATNNGSLYRVFDQKEAVCLFASERYMLQRVMREQPDLADGSICHMAAGDAAVIDLAGFKLHPFRIDEKPPRLDVPGFPAREGDAPEKRDIRDICKPGSEERVNGGANINTGGLARLEGMLQDNSAAIGALKRCTRCLLPETFPFITFDEQGLCGVCRVYRKLEYKGVDALEGLLAAYKNGKNRPDVIVPLSGGRDSTFALHYIKTRLDMNPVAYTYDWGMVTDLARRNISRLTAKLGVEHILVSADIKKKRRYIGKNVNAWLKRPRLGTVPLFMAGDKQFFYYANMLKKQTGIQLLLFGMNPLEQGDFKVGFTGIREKKKQDRFYHLSGVNKLRLLFYYAGEAIMNPSLINRSLADTLGGYISYYLISHDYHIFFEYYPWKEEEVVRTIIDEYNWETAEDTDTTWRIGDGTASFYNYIYTTVAGFSENDTFRGNQVRQGLISRKDALKRVNSENKPRFQSIKWYCDTNHIDYQHAIQTINNIPKLY
jgi:asparagine synthetase B (glutamine-hydrolysing)